MVRMVDLPAASQANLEQLECPEFHSNPWTQGPALAERKVVLISSAGLMLRGEKTVRRSEAGYRVIPHDAPAGDILMSHVSINYDRTGFQQDLNVILPRERLDELVAGGEVGAAAANHYSFMGATEPGAMESHARELAGRLKTEQVDTAVFLPV